MQNNGSARMIWKSPVYNKITSEKCWEIKQHKDVSVVIVHYRRWDMKLDYSLIVLFFLISHPTLPALLSVVTKPLLLLLWIVNAPVAIMINHYRDASKYVCDKVNIAPLVLICVFVF